LRGGPVQIRRRVVNRVAAHDDERRDLARVERRGQRGQIFRDGRGRFDQLHRLANAAELVVDRVSDQMDR